MKANHTDHLPFLYTSETRPAISTSSNNSGCQKNQPRSFTEILHLHKTNNSVQFLEKLLDRASSISASHVYIEPEETVLRIRYRTLGQLSEEIAPSNETSFDINELLTALYKTREEILSFEEPSILKASFGTDHYDLILMPLQTTWGLSLTIGLNKTLRFAPTLDELEIPHFTLKQLRDILNAKSGFLLLTGPIASGKQFTRLAVLQALNTPDSKIFSIEERSSLQLPRVCHVPINIGTNVNKNFVHHLLQQAPDICSTDHLVQSEILIPLLKATLNHTMLVASTHASSAIDALLQLKAIGCNKHIIAQSLKGILTQQEIPKVCPDCKKVHHLSSSEKKWIQQNFPGVTIVEGSFTVGEGCDTCANTGLSGVCTIYELIGNSEELSEAIIEGSRSSLTTAISLRNNFQTLRQKAFSLANSGLIPLQQVILIP